MIAAAAALFAACSDNDTFKEVAEENVEIGFSSQAVSKATRAVQGIDLPWFQTVGSATEGHRFGVYGFKNVFLTGSDQYKIDTQKGTDIFNNEIVYCSDVTTSNNVVTSVTWSHNTIRFWDKAATKAYNFYAYAPYATANVTYAKGSVQGTGEAEASRQNYSPTFTFTNLPLIAEITEDNCDADKMVAAAVKEIDYATITADSYANSHSATHGNAPTVKFTFNHILSKLSFKVVTDIKKHNETDGVATFTVKEIDFDFPLVSNVQDVVSFASENPEGAVTYATTPTKDGTYDVSSVSNLEVVYKSEAGFVVPSTLSSSNNTALEPTISVTADANNVASKTYIVTPVAATGYTEHSFDVKVTYDVEYPNDVTETGCIATGTIAYSPEQNDYYIVVIKLDPAQIEFCVESVNDWDPQDEDANTHEVN